MVRLALMCCAVLACWLGLAQAGPSASAAAATSSPQVAVSIAPIHALVAEVMHGVAVPTLMIDAGVSPHGFAWKPSQAAALARAEVVFWIGGDFEAPLRSAIATLAPKARVITLSERPEIVRLAQRNARKANSVDPHLWLDPYNAIAIVRLTAAVLSGHDPRHAPRYAANAEAAVRRLEHLAQRLADRLAPIRQRPYVVVHDAYQYLEARYALHNLGAIKGAAEQGREPRHIHRLNRQVADHDVRCVFAERQFDGDGVHGLDSARPLTLAVLDPLGQDLPPGLGLYDAMMLRLTEDIVACLGR